MRRPDLSKAAMSPEERALRSKAAQLLSGGALVHGYVSTRYHRCGKPTCRCTRGQKHLAYVLVVRKEGRTSQIPIPKPLEPLVRRWVEQEKNLQEILTRICELQVERLHALKQQGAEGR